MTEQRICQAIAIGVVFGIPLTILGELFLVTSAEAASLHMLAQIMTAPGGLYRAMTGRDVFASAGTMSIYLLIQASYYTAIAYAVLLVIHKVTDKREPRVDGKTEETERRVS